MYRLTHRCSALRQPLLCTRPAAHCAIPAALRDSAGLHTSSWLRVKDGEAYKTEELVQKGDFEAFKRVALARNACKSFSSEPVSPEDLKDILAVTLVWGQLCGFHACC